MIDKLAILGILSDADMQVLPAVLAKTIGPETEVLHLILSRQMPRWTRGITAKVIQTALKKADIRVEVKACSDKQILWLQAYHTYVQKRYFSDD